MILLGLDIGTTSTIGILVEANGRVLATASRPVALSSPKPGWAEEDPAEWWGNACAIIHELLAEAGVRAADVAAIGATGMVPALLLLDAEGRLIRPSIQQSDGRTAAEVEEIRSATDEGAFVRRTGNGINQQLVAPKLRWLAKHEPENFARIATMFGSYDFIAWKLSGALSLERNWALEAGFLDLGTGALADDLVALGGRPGALPPLRDAHEIVGRVTPGAAAATGLAAGTPVVAGCADHVASAFVAGIARPGDLLIKFGGAGDILLATDAPRPDPRLFLDFHLVPGLFLPNGCMASSGAVLNWIVREWGGGLDHAALDARAEAVPPGAEGLLLLPYFLGEKTPLHDPHARGTLVGLGLHHGLGHVWRAALEAVCFGFRHHLEVLRELGQPVTRIIASDGGAQSALWMRIAAGVLGQPVQLLHGHPGSCLGAAYVAGMAVGAFPDWNEMGRFVRPARVVQPDPAWVARYDALYPLWRETYERLKPLYPKLAATV
ncbi:carbohydrate kinase [Falsiroseomonas bella]|uniref:Carbohydrate kinase n=1 Tax=Falsiroseomonas bella TaxID=2184016 RepID=A0A317FHA2_9PROT|nr:FGGY family carbohydrate kinase [Falsiroseomonas bella]PWS37963.1 carbohydrate kinase [Falsiroseomonas bella]